MTVEFFTDGSALLDTARVQGGAPKVLLLDLEMPLLDGLETLKSLAIGGFLRETTSIIFSTEVDADYVRQAYAFGASFYIRKPCSGDEYRQLARLCVTCAYINFAQPQETRALTVAEALGIAAVKSALV